MSRVLHQVSAVLFYLLGTSFFVAYLLFRNEMYVKDALWWLQVGDLPLIGSAFIYGGTSLYRSIMGEAKTSWTLAIVISLILIVLFGVMILLNFWEVLPLSQGETIF